MKSLFWRPSLAHKPLISRARRYGGALGFSLALGALSWGCGTDDPDGQSGSGGSASGGSSPSTGGSSSGGAVAGGGSSSGGASGGVSSGGSGPSSGGALVEGSGGAGSGGEGPGSGGADPGTGGSATGGAGSGGGGGMVVSACPDGPFGAPTLEGKTPTQIMDVPQPANGGFTEGPVWYNDKLFLSQIEFGNQPESGDVLVYTPGSGFLPFQEDVGTNGLAIDGMGRLIAASQQFTGVIAFDADDPTQGPGDIARMYDGKAFNSPNDVTVRSDGTVYFTDPKNNCGGACAQAVEGVYRVPPGGQPELLTTLQNSPNGIALSPDETVLYIGGSSLSSHPVMPDGSVGPGTAFGDLTSNTDGLGVDCAGNLYVALYSMHQVIAFTPAGQRLPGALSVQEVTNIAFGGPERKTMYITGFGDNKGRLYSVEMEVPGLPF